jgi:hypothetical protein
MAMEPLYSATGEICSEMLTKMLTILPKKAQKNSQQLLAGYS